MKPTEQTYIRDKVGNLFLRLGLIKDVLSEEEIIQHFGKYKTNKYLFRRMPNGPFCHGEAELRGDVVLTPDEVEALKIELL